jgi:hypothetical protein
VQRFHAVHGIQLLHHVRTHTQLQDRPHSA